MLGLHACTLSTGRPPAVPGTPLQPVRSILNGSSKTIPPRGLLLAHFALVAGGINHYPGAPIASWAPWSIFDEPAEAGQLSHADVSWHDWRSAKAAART